MRGVEEREPGDEGQKKVIERKQQDIEYAKGDRRPPQSLGPELSKILDRVKRKFAKRSPEITKQSHSNGWSPPKGNYTKVPNRFIEAIYRQYLRPTESKILWLLVRKTWGWQKPSDFISPKQFERKLDISKSQASKAVSALKKRRIVVQLGNKTYAVEPDTTLWRNRPKRIGKHKIREVRNVV